MGANCPHILFVMHKKATELVESGKKIRNTVVNCGYKGIYYMYEFCARVSIYTGVFK